MRVLLDTNVVSEFAKGPSPVDALVDSIPDADIFISTLSMGEIQKGISLRPVGRGRLELENWFEELKGLYADRSILFDLEAALIWGELAASTICAGRNIGTVDLQIAAIAFQHDLTVITRNVRDFIPTGVPVINPWDS
ncbi:MAG TPA: type II toxin-antitoxin system VapC family toxin [Thermomicrobiales bacterium]|nr:type II toxin-antitoxin system VapC family toxin [Thermomicrobiales bacterium]